MADRYVVLGLAHPRAQWFSEVSRWATMGSAPLDFVKCVSAEEVHARLASGRAVSALLADADRIANDRDLVDRARRSGCSVIVVDDGRLPRDWGSLGVAAALLVNFGRDELVAALGAHAAPVGSPDRHDVVPTHDAPRSWRGRLIAVTGAGGTGSSVIAMALAQGIAVDPAHRGLVLLADLCLDADLAMLHDARDVVPGLQELVEACRGGVPADDLTPLVYQVADRRYDLLLGLRRHRDWTAIKPRSFDVALDTLRRRYRLVVADVDADVEGEDETGSLDIADRNHIARSTIEAADLVLVVGAASLKGMHSLARTLHDLRATGIAADRLVPVVNRIGRSPRQRAEFARVLAELGGLSDGLLGAPLFVPDRRHLDDGLLHAAPLPHALVQPVARAALALLDRTIRVARPDATAEPVAVVPGSLGAWYEQPEDSGMIRERTPLEEIEQAVQTRAKRLTIALEGNEGVRNLRTLVDEEIDRWQLDHRRGARPFDLADPELVAERAVRNLAGYGPLGPLLEDDDVWEVMINSPSQIFVKRHGGPSGYHHEVFHDDDHVFRTLTKILDDASTAHRKLDPSEGLQDAQLDSGARLHIVHGDIARGGHLVVNIRKFTGIAFRELGELVDAGMLDDRAAAFLTACVGARCSMVVAGIPGSGKTTLLSCCAAALDPSLRVVVAEEVFETDVPLPNVASMQTRAARADRPEIDLRRLVSGFLRMAPDVAIVGEVRDREALPLLLTLSSGVQGFTTIHAGSARQALTRLRFICQLADTRSELPVSALNTLVSESIDVVVHCVRGPSGPRVSSIVAVEDLTGPSDATQFTITEVFARAEPAAPLEWTGQIPSRLARRLAEHGHEIRSLLGAERRDSTGSRPMIAFALAVVAATGVGLLLDGRRSEGDRRGSTISARDRSRALTSALRARIGIDEVAGREFAAVVAVLALAGGAIGWAMFAGVLPALALSGFAGAFPVASARVRAQTRRARALEAWPRLIEELRILTGSLGRSIPQALFEVGLRGPDELRPAFEAAQREWLLSTDFARTIHVLKTRLADATTDAVCETLLVAHELGGSEIDRRLAALAEDRRIDCQGRKDARSRQAGARFARRFVLIVPLGMAMAGMSVGDGRTAYSTATGQILVLVGIAVTVACWMWASRIMRLPIEQRVFDR